MLNALWDTRQYFFWLALISVLCFVLERVVPWRRDQGMLRSQFGQDVFWLVFNGHYLGILLSYLIACLLATLGMLQSAVSGLEQLAWLLGQPLWVQLFVFIVALDFVE